MTAQQVAQETLVAHKGNINTALAETIELLWAEQDKVKALKKENQHLIDALSRIWNKTEEDLEPYDLGQTLYEISSECRQALQSITG